jgi:hypothetical protein
MGNKPASNIVSAVLDKLIDEIRDVYWLLLPPKGMNEELYVIGMVIIQKPTGADTVLVGIGNVIDIYRISTAVGK